MDTYFYNIGSGLTDISATSITTDTLVTDDINSVSGIINFNVSSLSNIQNVYVNNNVISANITSLSNSHMALSNSHTALSNSHSALSNSHMALSNAYVSYSNVSWKFNTSNLYLPSSSNVCIGTQNATQQLTLTGSIQASNLHTSNLIIYRGSNILDTDGKIDYSWIKNAPIYDDGTGVIIIPVPIFTTINNNVNVNTGGGGDENYDPDNNASNIFVHWRNVTYHPFYCRTGTDEQVAFGSNVFIEKNSKIYGVDSVDLIKTDAGRTRRLDSSLLNPVVFYDFATQECFVKVLNSSSNINASNITTRTLTSSNITSSNINASNMSTASFTATNSFSSNMVASNVFSSNIVNNTIWSSNAVLSNISSCNFITMFAVASNLNSSNIFASNIETRTFVTSNATACNINANFITATNIAGTIGNIGNILYVTSNIYSSNVSSCNINVLESNYQQNWQVNESNIFCVASKGVAIGKSNPTQKLDVEGTILGSNVAFSNFLIYRGSNIVDSTGKIDFHTWISNKMFSSNAIGATIGNLVLTSNATTLTGTAMSLNFKSLFLNNGNIAGDFLQHLNELGGNSNFGSTGGDTFSHSSQSSNILTNWNSVIWKPVYQDSNFNVGFSSNVYFNKSSQLCTTEPLWDYTKTSNGMFKTFNAPFVRSNVVIDFNTLTATFCNVITSNLTVLGTTTSNIITSNITTRVITASNAFLSNVWASNVGINQINPLYNLDINGSARVQQNMLVNRDVICTCNVSGTNATFTKKITCVNLGLGEMETDTFWANNIYSTDYAAGTINQALDLINTGSGNGTFVRQSMKVGAESNANSGFTTHGGIDVGVDLDGLNYLRIGVSNQSGGFPVNQFVLRQTGFIGMGTASPAYRLDIASTGMRLQGGTGATPTIFYLNSTGVGNTTSQLQFVNAGHMITCTDSNNYQGIANVGGGHNIYYSSGGHNFNGIARFNNSVYIPSTNVIEFGIGVSGKEANAGKMGYQTFTSGALDIVGAGSTDGNRGIKLWDNVTIANNLTVSGAIQIGSGGTSILSQKLVSTSIASWSGSGALSQTITHSLGTASYEGFFSAYDLNSSVVTDCFVVKITAKGTNTCTVNVMRADSVQNGWTRAWTLVSLFIIY
jgi:hypothetical protein